MSYIHLTCENTEEPLSVLDCLGWKGDDFTITVFEKEGTSVVKMVARHRLTGFEQTGTTTGGNLKLLKRGLLRALIHKVLDYEASKNPPIKGVGEVEEADYVG